MADRTVETTYVEPASAGARHVEPPGALRRISWGAIFAGTAIVLVSQLLLGMLGVGIGATTLDPTTQGSPSGQALGVGAALWWVLCSLVSVFLGALVAGRLAGTPLRLDGALQGLVTWAFSTLVLVWMLTTTAAGLVGGAFSVVGQAVQTGAIAGVAAREEAGNGEQGLERLTEAVRRQADALIARMSGRGDLSAEDAAAAAEALARSGGDEAAAARTLAERTGMTEEQARQAVAEWRQRGGEDARQGAERTAEPVAQASIWSFAAFVLGALAAALGGAAGAPRELPSLRRTRAA